MVKIILLGFCIVAINVAYSKAELEDNIDERNQYVRPDNSQSVDMSQIQGDRNQNFNPVSKVGYIGRKQPSQNFQVPVQDNYSMVSALHRLIQKLNKLISRQTYKPGLVKSNRGLIFHPMNVLDRSNIGQLSNDDFDSNSKNRMDDSDIQFKMDDSDFDNYGDIKVRMSDNDLDSTSDLESDTDMRSTDFSSDGESIKTLTEKGLKVLNDDKNFSKQNKTAKIKHVYTLIKLLINKLLDLIGKPSELSHQTERPHPASDTKILKKKRDEMESLLASVINILTSVRKSHQSNPQDIMKFKNMVAGKLKRIIQKLLTLSEPPKPVSKTTPHVEKFDEWERFLG